MSGRTDRIDELLRQEIGQALARELADPGLGFVTVTKVETSPDLRHARLWVSVIGSDDERETSLAALRRAMPYVRHELGPRLRLKRIPEFSVRLDDSMERGTRVLRILQELEGGRAPEEVAGESDLEPLPTPLPRLPHAGDAAGDPDDARADAAAGGTRAQRGQRRPRRGSGESRSAADRSRRPPTRRRGSA